AKPFGNNVAWRRNLEVNDPATGHFVSGSTETNFNQNANVGPRLWLGVQDTGGLGARVRWFGLENTVNTAIANDYRSSCNGKSTENCLTLTSAAPFLGEQQELWLSAGYGHSLILSNQIKFNVFDAEVTQLFSAGRWLLLTGGGIRYASV